MEAKAAQPRRFHLSLVTYSSAIVFVDDGGILIPNGKRRGVVANNFFSLLEKCFSDFQAGRVIFFSADSSCVLESLKLREGAKKNKAKLTPSSAFIFSSKIFLSLVFKKNTKY